MEDTVPMIEDSGIYNKEVVDYKLIKYLFPFGGTLETLFQPYISTFFKKNNILLKCEINKFKKRFGITNDILSPVSKYLKVGSYLLAGGKMIDFVLNKTEEESTNDFDIFLSRADSYIHGTLEMNFIDDNWKKISTIAHLCEYSKDNHKVQVINKYFSNEESIIEQFDIRACAICTDGEYVYWFKGAIRDIIQKQIVMLSPRGNLLAMHRITKYINKGFEISIPDLAMCSIRFLDNIMLTKDPILYGGDPVTDRAFEFDRLARNNEYENFEPGEEVEMI